MKERDWTRLYNAILGGMTILGIALLILALYNDVTKAQGFTYPGSEYASQPAQIRNFGFGQPRGFQNWYSNDNPGEVRNFNWQGGVVTEDNGYGEIRSWSVPQTGGFTRRDW